MGSRPSLYAHIHSSPHARSHVWNCQLGIYCPCLKSLARFLPDLNTKGDSGQSRRSHQIAWMSKFETLELAENHRKRPIVPKLILVWSLILHLILSIVYTWTWQYYSGPLGIPPQCHALTIIIITLPSMLQAFKRLFFILTLSVKKLQNCPQICRNCIFRYFQALP